MIGTKNETPRLVLSCYEAETSVELDEAPVSEGRNDCRKRERFIF